eukprot:214225_1
MEPHGKRETVDINPNNGDSDTPHDDSIRCHPTATNSVHSPSLPFLTMTASNPRNNSDMIGLQLDDAVQSTLHGMSSLISLPLSEAKSQSVTITHVPQEEHLASLESDNSDESDSVSSGAMHNANVSYQILQKIETNYAMNVMDPESTLRVHSSGIFYVGYFMYYVATNAVVWALNC